jgi:hypothetical protein
MSIPIIDLFAGPGGLGEGFSSLRNNNHEPVFKIGLSIEKNSVAHKTLALRAVFRRLRGTEHIRHYYQYIRQEINEVVFRAIPAVADAFAHAEREARCLELGKADERAVDADIRAALAGCETWVHPKTPEGKPQGWKRQELFASGDDGLFEFVNNELLPYLHALDVNARTGLANPAASWAHGRAGFETAECIAGCGGRTGVLIAG